MIAEIINTGSELLLGQVVNTHLAFLGEQLFRVGFRVERQIAIPDGAAIQHALEEAFTRRPDVIFVTGGLGPTTDDITRDLLAEMLGVEQTLDPDVLQMIEERFARRNFVINDRVRRQAFVPEGLQPILNFWGTAPGLFLAASASHPATYFLPGPPRELRPMFTEWVVPHLRITFPAAPDLICKIHKIAGLGESAVEEKIGKTLLALPGLELGYCARSGEVDLRVIGPAAVVEEANGLIEAALAANIYARDDGTMEQAVVEGLRAKQWTVSTAESCTGGFLAHRLTNVPGASEVLHAGYVTYANAAKSASLGVDPLLIEENGAVSEPVAAAMAEGARRVSGADLGISTTGIAGPGGGTEAKPVGTVFIGLADAAGVKVTQHFFPTDRETFKFLVTQTALNRIREALLFPG